VSTDYVFDGAATAPYPEDAVLAPRSAYGRSKAAGELAVRALLPNAGYVVRTAWLYGEHGANFVTTMLRLEQSHETVQVVRDQRGQPTWSRDVALRLATMVKQDLIPGTYHATSSGATTWFDVARAVFAAVGADPERVQPTTTANFPRPAPRPAYSVLGHDAWRTVGLAPLRDWQVALEEAVPLLRAAVEAA
jgi:dTDP-4-dehydrorhamnose reductase